MAISKGAERSDEIETSEKYNKINQEDVKLIVSLLNEYSEKLFKLCVQIETTGNRGKFSVGKFLYTIWVPIFRIGITFLLFFVIGILFRVFDFSKEEAQYTTSLIPFVLSFLIIGTGLLDFPKVFFNEVGSSQLSSKDIATKDLAIRLERLVQVAGQIEEQVSVSFASRIEFDLRLGDAEAALALYKELSKKYLKD
jgi:hypothetical protein